MSTGSAVALLEKEALLKRKVELQEGLPFLYGWPWYPWAKEFFECTNRMSLLCAANQISKSSTQIRKCIDWATDKSKWPRLWRTQPRQFWYLYPTKEVASIEFEEKWKPEFMPNGKFKDDPVYGWREEWQNKSLFAVYFNSGVSVYFKTYAQDVQHLQSGSVHAIFSDEEVPEELLSELQARLLATDGYFSMVFTATLGQEIWRRALEEIGNSDEAFKTAWKKQISMFDCLAYEDGSSTPWTKEKIQVAIAQCPSQAEVLRRIYGRFVLSEGKTYPGFERGRNLRGTGPVSASWRIYSGVDPGSGGEKGHPAALCFVAVDPLHRQGRVFRAWRGDKIETTAADILTKYREIRGGMPVTGQYYDWAAKDFFTLACRMGESFLQADKSHAIGEDILNVLFKNNMLTIDEGDMELEKLAVELSTLKKDGTRSKLKNDLCDALRYACAKIPWDFTVITGDKPDIEPEIPEGLPQTRVREGEAERAQYFNRLNTPEEQEFEEWNEHYGV